MNRIAAHRRWCMFGAVLICAGGVALITWRSGEPNPVARPSRSPTAQRIRAASAAVSIARAGDTTGRHDAILAFDDWVAALADGRQPDIGEGMRLARSRRAALKELIRASPQEALQHAVPRAVRATLPDTVRAELETPIDAYGSLEVLQVCTRSGGAVLRQAHVNGRRFDVYTHGRRNEARTRHRLALHGITIDEAFAVADAPFRRLEAGERAGDAQASAGLAVASGDTIRFFADENELARWSGQQAEFEAAPNPDAAADAGRTVAAATAEWVTGEKTVLWIRVEFPDDPGSPATDQDIATAMAAVNQFYAEVSRDRTSFKTNVVPGLLRLSRAKSTFQSGAASHADLRSEALALAKAYDAANGNSGLYDPDRHDRYIVVFKYVDEFKMAVDDGEGPVPATWAGLATIGGKGVLLNGQFQSSQYENFRAHVVAHELGHNQGLFHSHAWIPREGRETEYFKVGGHCEYGDPFDVMGASVTSPSMPVPSGHFNAVQKSHLGYLAATEIRTVTSSGVYRINRSDHRRASGVQALRIAAGDAYDYWLEYTPDSAALDGDTFSPKYAARCRNGVLMHWGRRPSFASGAGTYLVDATPLRVTKDGWMNDAPLGIGEVFRDPDFGMRIAPLAVGGASPGEYIDVEISLGAAASTHEGPGFASMNVLYDDRSGQTVVSAGSNVTVPVAARGYAKVQLWADGQLLAEKAGDNPSFLWTPRTFGWSTLRLRAIDAAGRAYDSIPVPMMVDLADWQWAAPAGQGNTLRAVRYALGRWWAVGEQGTILVSTDARRWSRVPVPTTASLVSLATDGTRLVAASDPLTETNSLVALPNAYWTTSDGNAWRNIFFSLLATNPTAVGFAGGTWILAGSSKLYRAPRAVDSTAWSESSSEYSINSVAYGGSRWVGVGPLGKIHTSSDDGRTWTAVSSPTSQGLEAVASDGSRWVAVGGGGTILTSADGVTWTAVAGAPRAWLRGVSVVGGRFVIVGSGGLILSSADGLTWETHPQSRYADLYSIAEHDGTIVAVGQAGEILTGGSLSELTPVDPSPRMGAIAGLAVDGSKVVAVGTSSDFFLRQNRASIQTLGDGLGWLPLAGTPVLPSQGGIAFGRGIFVSAGVAGRVFTSTDGLAWDPRRSGVTRDLNAVAIGPATMVVVGDGGTVAVSADGSTWSPRASGTNEKLRGLAYGRGRFVAVGDNGTILSSMDGEAWRAQASGVTAQLNAVEWSDAAGFVAVGNSGAVLTSPDGLNWVRRTVANSERVNLTGLTATPHGVAALAENHLLVSPDGATWSRVASGMAGATAITYSDGTLWIAGGNGRVLKHALGEPGRLINLSILTSLAGGGDGFTVGAVIGGGAAAATQSLLVRAVGPSLRALGIDAPLPDPTLELFRSGIRVAANDDWGGGAALLDAFGRAGAFALESPASRDAAIAHDAVPAGNYTVQIADGAGASGAVIAEIYDTTPADGVNGAMPRLLNVSVLKHVEPGDVLTGGFVVGGGTPRQVLVRAIGPSLAAAPFNIDGAMPDPKVELFRAETRVAANDNWAVPATIDGATAAQLADAFDRVAAFAIPTGSKDACLVAMLSPGTYSAQVRSAGDAGGIVIVEIYEVPAGPPLGGLPGLPRSD